LFTISVETHFWASHRLTLPNGSKEPVHRHNWAVRAYVSSDRLNDTDVVMDFRRLKELVDNIVADFDNLQLEQLDYFQQNNPSAENVARYIYDRLEPKLPNCVELKAVRVTEQPGCSATFAK
jgi:6-pyruvoyltetrahydropterin/6-carboxytetrahydropterin synthase